MRFHPGNRVVYRQPEPIVEGDSAVGHPTWYGKPFKLKDLETWGEPDEVAQTTFTTRGGRSFTVELQGWHDLLRRGKQDIPMYRYPFTLLRARVLAACRRTQNRTPISRIHTIFFVKFVSKSL